MTSEQKSSEAFLNLLSSFQEPSLDTFAKRLHPEVRWTADLLPGGASEGSQAVAEFLGLIRSGFSDFRLEPDEHTSVARERALPAVFENAEDPRHVSFRVRFDGVNSGYLPNVGVTDRPITLIVHGTARMDAEGNLVALSTSWNCARALAQLGIRAHMRPDPLPAKAMS